MGNDIEMSTKKINAGDTLTVGDLTDDYLGAVIEVGPVDGFTTRFKVQDVTESGGLMVGLYVALMSEAMETRAFKRSTAVKVITPPPVVQPDEPTDLGQCIRIEGDDGWRAVVVESDDDGAPIRDTDGSWYDWDLVRVRAGSRRIIVSDPPRWPDETPVVPERIERSDWPADDTHLRDYKWIDRDGGLWRWDDRDNRKSGWNWNPYLLPLISPLFGPWTRGERVK